MNCVQQINPLKIKFLDESHFVSRDLIKKRVLGRVNVKTFTRENTLHEPSFSLTLFATLEGDEPIITTIREESNSQYDFIYFLIYLLSINKLTEGDYLIMDNASVHMGCDTIQVAIRIMEAHGVNLIFLPTYSPELNPCELVFSKIKKKIRTIRNGGSMFLSLIRALSMIKREDIINYYSHCIFLNTILPDVVDQW